MAEEQNAAVEETHTTIVDPQLEVRSEDRRELGLFIVPWDTVVNTNLGPEMFRRGAFADTDPNEVRLRMDHQDPPTGRGFDLEEKADGAYMGFRVSKTSRGNDQIELAKDGTSVGASVGFESVPNGTTYEQINGRGVRVHRKVILREVSTTWRPVYERAAVMYVRSKDAETEVGPMPDSSAPQDAGATTETTAALTPTYDFSPFERAVGGMTDTLSTITDRLAKLEERSRSEFSIPTGEPEKPKADRGQWMQAILRMLSGERIPDLQMRQLADLITTDNIGVVPDAFLTELIGVIDPSRPFMNTTRRLNTPASGMSLTVPRIVTRPTVGIQATEKTELTSTATAVDTVTFDAVSKGGAGDISLQLLKRSDPSFLDLYLRLLAEAYAQDSEQEAVEAALAGGVESGGEMDPEDLNLGTSWANTFGAYRRGPDTIWMSSAAVGEFIDAKANGTNAPLYSQLSANFTAGGGVGGSISGLRAVHVPALDATGVDVLVGPANGFAWAEDGTYTLQVDVPAKAGRDVAIIGMLWFAPLYPGAFTAYSVAGGGS